MGSKPCHSGHRDRLRKRYLEFGNNSFQEHELLELILFYGIPRKNTNEIAHNLISEFGDIRNVLNADEKELMRVSGIGESAASFLKLFGEVCREYESLTPDSDLSLNIEEYPAYFRESFKTTAEGICLLLCPDNNFRIVFSKDAILNESADMIHILNQIVRKECTRVVVGINRIYSAASPETDDVKLADLLSAKLSLLGIDLFDFLIIGRKRAYSLIYDGAFIF